MTPKTLDDFDRLVQDRGDVVVLAEGRRTLTERDAADAGRLTAFLAGRHPRLRFRSGNAAGADHAFSAAVAALNPERLHVIAPYRSHRQKDRFEGAVYDTPDLLDDAGMQELVALTIQASPKNRGLIEKRGRGAAFAAKASYLLRDTFKVTGDGGAIVRPVCAFFVIDPADPEGGGTGHTIRVCRLCGVPVVTQETWRQWLPRR